MSSESAQNNINLDGPGGGGSGKKNQSYDDGPIFDKTDIGLRLNKKKGRNVFGDVELR